LRVQFISAVAVTIIFGYINSDWIAASVFGGLIPVSATMLLIFYSKRAERVDSSEAGSNISLLYRCAIERMVLVVILFAMGLGLMNLEPLPMIITFVIGQMVFLMGRLEAQQ
jgi:ATP synthase protein I